MSTSLLLLTLLWLPQPVRCTPQFAPLNTGTSTGGSTLQTWRKDEAGKWGGKGWLGWTWDTQTLRPVSLKVQPAPRVYADFDEVSVEGDVDADYAVRCIPNVRAGKMLQARDDDGPVMNEHLVRDRPLRMSLGERRYEVRLESPHESLVHARVTLSDGRLTQVLYSAGEFVDEPHFIVEWAGDVDRDGRLDLVVNLSHKYSIHPIQLLLSSKASARQLVGSVATFLAGD